MAKISTNLGKVATTPKGEYNSATKYERLDIVSYEGSSYVCLQESLSNLPTNTTYWQLIASKGAPGADGEPGKDGADGQNGKDGKDGQDGYTPVKGVDYFTTSDIESLDIYHKPANGIPSTDMSSAVQTSLGKADSALQTEQDPVFSASAASGISSNDINKWNNKSDFSGSYNDLSDKPTIPTIPTNVSAFTNDAGYLTQHQDISGKEDKTNKVTSISSSSTDTQYPSAKCVYDIIGNINTILATLATPSVNNGGN